MGISEEHAIMMKELRTLFPKKCKIIYADNFTVSVPCTISKPDVNNINYDKFVGQNVITINILIDDLKLINAPIKDFLYLTLDRVEYQVESSIVNGIFNNTIQLQCKLFKSGNA